jgi:hypothetical protein
MLTAQEYTRGLGMELYVTASAGNVLETAPKKMQSELPSLPYD